MSRLMCRSMLLCGLLVVGASCSSSSDTSSKEAANTPSSSTKKTVTYDASVVEAALKSTQKDVVNGLPLGEATCPVDVKVIEGVTFTCTLQVGDAAAPFTVDLTKVDTTKPNIHVLPQRAIIDISKAVAFLKSNLTAGAAAAQSVGHLT